MKNSVLLCAVLLCSSALAAPQPSLPPYRVVLIDDVTVNSGMLGGLSQFPYGERRFQMAGTLPDLVVVGTAAFQRNDGTNNESLARGRTWTWNSGAWTEATIISEGSGNPRIATLAMDINADGVIVGAIAEPNISSVWNRNASVWRPVSSSLVQSDLTAPSGSCQPTDSVALGVGPGEDPAVAGFVATRCQYGLYEPFTGWLDADPNYGGLMEPALGSVFRCDFNQPVIVGVAHAIVPWQGDDVLAIGDRLEYSGQPNCQTPLTPCDDTGITSYDAHGWWVGEGNANDLVIAGNSGYRFWASDGQAMPAIEETPGWSVAGGWLRESSGEVCYDNAAVYIGYIPDTLGYQSSFAQATTYPVQPAIVLSDESDPEEMPSSQAATAIRSSDPTKAEVDWLACGARFGQRDYGIIWAGRDDGEGGVEWCGRNVNDLDVAWIADENIVVTAIHDILANGVAVGVGPGESPTQRLVVLTSLGDINCDFVVDGADLGILLGQWSSTYASNPWRTADLDRDGYVNGADLGGLLAVWTGGELVQILVGCEDWQTIEPFDLEGALEILGFDGPQDLGEYCLSIDIEDAIEVVEYVEFVAREIATEVSE